MVTDRTEPSKINARATMANIRKEVAEKLKLLDSLFDSRISILEKKTAAHGAELDAHKALMAIVHRERVDEDSAVLVLGKVTPTHDIFGAQIEALKGEIAAASANAAVLQKEHEVLLEQGKQVEDWLVEQGIGWRRVTPR
ncbi:uncharacterized protein N0V89_006705 [Didymosphaeria variabile]|uniref:Uncharacterized protein n=1 Tax=Didymosphaeria variabile TaxID=1932322 RepID=A0A9W8XK28_9PLEO|nr:uncharacterized protein N0V89_006705 [Didymosphaeria variabile]KAJ4351365.1 hypothetical protein N0V89_006705 [Didymosphaeria variabile]